MRTRDRSVGAALVLTFLFGPLGAFDVPPDATELTLRVKGNITASGALFDLSGAP